MCGEHFIKGWSRTQQCVTMSSAEAELVAMVKASAEAMGIASMARDLREESRIVVNADSSVVIVITERHGAGKLRHINVSLLWVQEKSK